MIQLRMQERSVTSDELNSLLNMVQSHGGTTKLPYRTVGSAVRGMKFEPIRFTVDNSDEHLVICAHPTQPTHTVTQGPTAIEANFYVINEDTEEAWLVDSSQVDEFEQLPEVRQAFHKGDYWERDSDYEYVFADGGTYSAVFASDPVSRLDEVVTITHLTLTNGGGVPYEWYAKAEDGRYLYMRCRSGSVQARIDSDEAEDADPLRGEHIFHAYVGRDHPGTRLKKHEVYNLVVSVDYIEFDADDPEELPEVDEEFMMSVGPDMEDLMGDLDEMPEPDIDEDVIDDEDFYEGEIEEYNPDEE